MQKGKIGSQQLDKPFHLLKYNGAIWSFSKGFFLGNEQRGVCVCVCISVCVHVRVYMYACVHVCK